LSGRAHFEQLISVVPSYTVQNVFIRILLTNHRCIYRWTS